MTIRGGKLTLCIYQGKMFGKEKSGLLQKADVFVFPTYYDNECFPVVLLEAMQHKLPVVTTNEGGIPDIVEQGVNGFVCEKKDAVAVADRLAVLLTDESLRLSMGKSGYRKYKANYIINQFEMNMLDCLKISM